MQTNHSIKTKLRQPVWLLMAVCCIIFSSASKKLIEQKVTPDYYYSLSFNKKIKDGSRDKRDNLYKITSANKQLSPDNDLPVLFLPTSLISLALFYTTSDCVPLVVPKEQRLALAGSGSLYLRHHRLQV